MIKCFLLGRILVSVGCIMLFSNTVYGVEQVAVQNSAKTNIVEEIPKDKASCEKLHGRWGRVGIYPQEFCNLPTKDANKICNDLSECEGTCIAELTKDQLEKVWRQKAIIYTSGKCTAWRLTVGCKPVVRDGKVKGLFCQD